MTATAQVYGFEPQPRVTELKPTVKDGASYYYDLQQGSGLWLNLRKGKLTASTIGKLVTPATLKTANNDTSRAILYEMVAQRIADFLPENYVSYDMERGKEDELYARDLYSKTYAPVEECGFVTRDDLGFPFGYSPDGLVGDDGQIEIKSRKIGLQVAAILKHMAKGEVPPDDRIQVQAGLLATRRSYCDYVVYSGGMKMAHLRVEPNPEIHEALIKAGNELEAKITEGITEYHAFTRDMPDTEYRPFDPEIEV